jgi:iron complex outermembrane receptor protein
VFASLLCLSVFAAPAAASDDTAKASVPDAASTPALTATADAAPADNIVVTAQRRNQSTLDVGINVTEISPQTIRENRIERLGEIIQATSNVDVREIRPGGGQPAITIRGVGMNDFTVASNPSTAVYFDGIYSPNIGTVSQQFFDLQNVEVLKGPQSSLYGRNATAGAINITSAAPTDYLTGYFNGGFGNYKSVDGEGAISGPLGEGLTGRISVKTRQMYGDWMHNVYPGGQGIGNLHQVSTRAQLQYKPDDSPFEFRAIFQYQHENDVPGAFTAFGRHVAGGKPGVTTALCPSAIANQIDFANQCYSLFGQKRPSTDILTISEDTPWTVHGNTYTGTFLATYHGDGFDIKSTTGYLHWYEQYIKSDAWPVLEQQTTLDQKTRQTSEDLEIASTGIRKLDWLAGVYLADGDTNNPTYTLAPIQNADFVSLSNSHVRTAQAYAQLGYHFSSKLEFIAEARYIYEHDSKVGGTWNDKNADQIVDAGDVNQAFINNSFNQHAVTWKFNLNYKPDASMLLYASITHGYKSGGYIAPSAATNSSQLQHYDGENIYAYEVGAKKSLWNHAVDLSTSLFYYQYLGLQTNEQQLIGNLNINHFANIPHAHIKGIDMDVAFHPFEGFELKLDGGLIDTWVGLFASGGVVHQPGNKLANAPTFTGTASVRYQWHLTPKLDMAIGSSAHRQSRTYADTENTPLYRIDSGATLVDAQLQLILPNQGMSVMIWGKNLTNCEYTNSTFLNGSAVNTLFNMPRTYGVSFSKNF